MTDYWKLKDAGLCVRCRKPAREGKILCEACSVIDRINQKANRDRRRKQLEGLCRDCHKPLSGVDKAFYKTCAQCRFERRKREMGL